MGVEQSPNVELLEGMYTALNRDDMEAVARALGDDVVWVEPAGSRYAGTYHGVSGVTGLLETRRDDLDAIRITPERYIESGDTVVVEGRDVITSTAGTTSEASFAHVCDVHDGELGGLTSYSDTATFERAIEA